MLVPPSYIHTPRSTTPWILDTYVHPPGVIFTWKKGQLQNDPLSLSYGICQPELKNITEMRLFFSMNKRETFKLWTQVRFVFVLHAPFLSLSLSNLFFFIYLFLSTRSTLSNLSNTYPFFWIPLHQWLSQKRFIILLGKYLFFKSCKWVHLLTILGTSSNHFFLIFLIFHLYFDHFPNTPLISLPFF